MKKFRKHIFIILIIFITVFITGCLSINKIESLLPNLLLNKGEEKEEGQIIYATLEIGGKKYQEETINQTTVYDLMRKLQTNKENNFSFSYKEYPGMGIFVDEINGIKGTSGAYWIYYINGKEASVGISNYILKSGDIINWKQE
jgi:hypothetical protein